MLTDDEKELFTSLGVQLTDDGELPAPNPNDPPADNDDPDVFDTEDDPPAPDAGNEPPKPEDTPPADTPNPTPAPTPAPAPDKSTAAFAQMRVENTQLKKTLESFATLLGIKTDGDVNAMADAVKNKVLEAQAAKDKIPVEYLQKLDRLGALEEHFTQEQLRNNATAGFQKVVDTFKLDPKALNAFVDELTASGVNPLTQPVDLVQEYMTRHFDEIIKSAEDRGKQEEAKRAAHAKEHGSEPGTDNGGKPEGQDKINTISQLDAFLNQK